MDVDGPNVLKRCLSVPFIHNNQSIASQSSTNMASTTTHSQPEVTSPISREDSPSPVLNIFAPRTRRYSASFSPLHGGLGPRLTPRVSQLRLEESADISNSREVKHEREIHSAISMSQSWEDLTLMTENFMMNPLQVTLPIGPPVCSSPSPTRNGLKRLPYSPSPTRKTFQTRRSMSPTIRPSCLGPVKRKFDLDDCGYSHSPPPFKKVFTESRGPSPSICQTPSPVCPSPDSFEGRITPKSFVSKPSSITTSSCSSPSAASSLSNTMEMSVDLNNANNELLNPFNPNMSSISEEDNDDSDEAKPDGEKFNGDDDENAKSDLINLTSNNNNNNNNNNSSSSSSSDCNNMMNEDNSVESASTESSVSPSNLQSSTASASNQN